MMLQIRYPAGRDPEWLYVLQVIFSEYLGIPYEAHLLRGGRSLRSLSLGDAQHRTLRVASDVA